ncbi:MAG: sensor domain-containing diguanylate cyclase [Candidatus Thiodiazotropha sp. (ex Ctena orbiculata)]|nr:sensor domain-containing diguanylate cyclase [Candidatus Thiodiazotropha taylori]
MKFAIRNLTLESQRIWPVILLDTLAAVLIPGLLGYTLWLDYSNRINTAKNNTRFVADIVAAQTSATIIGLDRMLHGVIIQSQMEHARDRTQASNNIDTYLKEIKSQNKNIMDLLMMDANGAIIKWTGQGEPPDVTDRDYVNVHFGEQPYGLYVGEPLVSKVHKGKWFFAVSKAVRKTNGDLDSIVTAIVDIAQFRSQFAQIQLLESSTLVLLTKKGNLVTRNPHHERFVGMNIVGQNAVWDLDRQGGNFELVSPLDRVERIVGYKLLRKYGIGAYSSVARDVVLNDWYGMFWRAIALMVLLLGIFGWLNRKIYCEKEIIDRQQRKLGELAITDELTGLYNRRHIMATFESERRRAQRYETPLSLLMIDIDHFKMINDEYGHAAGDAALRGIAEAMTMTVRDEAILARYGGEEFIVVLPMTSESQATIIAERIRRSIGETTIRWKSKKIRMTVSIGVAAYRSNVAHHSDSITISEADEALYEAKKAGRNRVVVAR